MDQFTINVGRVLKTNKRNKIKRGGKKNKNQALVLFSANAEGLKTKIESLKMKLQVQYFQSKKPTFLKNKNRQFRII